MSGGRGTDFSEPSACFITLATIIDPLAIRVPSRVITQA